MLNFRENILHIATLVILIAGYCQVNVSPGNLSVVEEATFGITLLG